MEAFAHRSLLDIEGLTRADVERILDTSEAFLQVSRRPVRKVPTLRGKTVDIAPSRYLDGLPDEHIRDYEQPEVQEMSVNELSSAARDLRAMLEKKRGAAPTPG